MDLSTLSNSLRDKIKYPSGMTPIETGILGSGFYPGCRGCSPPRSPVGGLMLLCRDFGTKTYYQSLIGLPPRDEFALPWRHTWEIYLSQGEPYSLCDLPVWCTNYLMGARDDGLAKGNIKDRFPLSAWLAYETSCWDFLHQQVLLQKPLVIVVFGGDNRSDLCVDARLGVSWNEDLRYTFRFCSKTHSAVITFENHPHSLITQTAKEAARRNLRRIRDLYFAEASRVTKRSAEAMRKALC